MFQLVERHLDELLRVWPQPFARQRGPLRAVVERVLWEFLRCGLLEHGFARIWCAECRRSEHGKIHLMSRVPSRVPVGFPT